MNIRPEDCITMLCALLTPTEYQALVNTMLKDENLRLTVVKPKSENSNLYVREDRIVELGSFTKIVVQGVEVVNGKTDFVMFELDVCVDLASVSRETVAE